MDTKKIEHLPPLNHLYIFTPEFKKKDDAQV